MFTFLRSLKVIHLEGNKMDSLPANIFNLTRTINITKETKKENIHCNFYKKPLSDCVGTHIQKCQAALELEEKEVAKFKIQGCARAVCKVEQTGKSIECYMVSSNANETSWSILGDNSAVKLALWTFGLLAVTSNFLVLLTLVCNQEARKSALCVFVMNLLLGNILIGIYIVIFTVSDTVTYGNFKQYGEGRWEGRWCVPMFFIKTIGLVLVVSSLLLVSIERVLLIVLNTPRHIGCCRSVGYVVESWIFACVVTIVLWTKTSRWGYLCSTHGNGRGFLDINMGIMLTLFSLCIIMVFLYIYLLCRLKGSDDCSQDKSEYRNTMRMFLLLLSTVITWAVPYIVMAFIVPLFISVTVSMQTLAISLTVNACLHPFIYSYDNDNLENLYSALSCKRESCLFLPFVVQGHSYEDEEEAKKKQQQQLALELDSFPKRSHEEQGIPVEVRSSSQYETDARMSPIHSPVHFPDLKRGSEVSKAEGAVIIRNKSPPGTSYQDDCSIVVHSAPSSPGPKEPRVFIDEHSDCGTMSSDTNVTWISSECTSHTHARLGDGNSTTSSRASSIPLGKSAASPHISRKRLSSVKSDSEERSEDDEPPEKLPSPEQSTEIHKAEEEAKDQKTESGAVSKRSRPMSPVQIICKVLSPKARKKRPKTDEGLPGTNESNTSQSRKKRSKSLLVGKEAKSAHVHEDVLDPLSSVTLREKKQSDQSRTRRNGVLVVRSGEIQLDFKDEESAKESDTSVQSPTNENTEKDWDKLSKQIVMRPSRLSMRQSAKEKKKGKLNRSLSAPMPSSKVRIYENPVADFANNNQTTDKEGLPSEDSVPLSPTRTLAKLEESDTVPELPKNIKTKYRNSTSSTSSSLRLSNRSLEWDPSCTDETHSDLDLLPPYPTIPRQTKPHPSATCTSTPSSSPRSSVGGTSETGECYHVTSDPANGSRYSLDWDPTSVQMRLSIVSHDATGDSHNQSDKMQVSLV